MRRNGASVIPAIGASTNGLESVKGPILRGLSNTLEILTQERGSVAGLVLCGDLLEVVDSAAKLAARLPVTDIQLEASGRLGRGLYRYYRIKGVAGLYKFARVEII